jgi:hypothetical protein
MLASMSVKVAVVRKLAAIASVVPTRGLALQISRKRSDLLVLLGPGMLRGPSQRAIAVPAQLPIPQDQPITLLELASPRADLSNRLDFVQDGGLSPTNRTRAPRRLDEYKPGEKIALDFHNFEDDPDGYKHLMLLTDRLSGYMWDFYLQDKTEKSIILALASFLGMLDRQYGIKVKAFESDNEIFTVKPRIKTWLEDRHIKIEPSPPHTQSLNGAAERSGGVVKEKANAMRDSSKLPVSLWREICKAAVYLLNRTPRKRIAWKTPFEIFHSTHNERRKLDLTNLRAYGCKSYAMTTTAMKKEDRLKRFNPRVWIGYLVGYASSKTYYIWNPVTNTVSHMHDAIFNEQETFSGALQDLRDDIKEVDRDELARLLSEFTLPSSSHEQVEPTYIPKGVDDTLLLQTGQQSEQKSEHQSVQNSQQPAPLSGSSGVFPAFAGGLEQETGAPELVGKELYTSARFELLPTPPPSPPAALLAVMMTGSVYQCVAPTAQRACLGIHGELLKWKKPSNIALSTPELSVARFPLERQE